MESMLIFLLRILTAFLFFPTSVNSFIAVSTAADSCFQSKRRYVRRPQRVATSTTAQEDFSTEFFDLAVSEKRIVSIESSLELPFSAEIAYDAYSNLPRQPSWSSWLHEVEYTDSSRRESVWTLKFLGFKYSWSATSLRNERPHIIQWKSTSGLANFGTVVFEPVDETNTTMSLTMTLAAPRAVAALFRKSRRLPAFIKEKMIETSLNSFKEVVLHEDLIMTSESHKL